LSAAPITVGGQPVTPSDLAWRVIGLLSLYRLLVPLVLLAMQFFAGPGWGLATARPLFFVAACVAYFTAAVLLLIARRLHWSSLRIVALVNASADAIAVGFILYAAGGVESGLAILLVLPVLALTVLGDHRDGLLIAAVAALAVLVQQVFLGITDAIPNTEYVTAGLFGIVLFVVPLLMWPLATRLRESEALVRRQELDLANMAQLSQYIVQHLRESILVVDGQDRIRLINESAALVLGDESAYPDALIGEASPRLLYLLESWRHRDADAGPSPASEQTFVAADGARTIRPHFAPLGTSKPPPVLIFLEDTTLLEEKVQQSKLAALGRLSASIAHEIRNPVGAMSHAGQLLAESPSLTDEDRRLTEIIRSNAGRVSDIIDNVQRLSRRERAHRERVSLPGWIEDFHEEFCETMQWPRARLLAGGDDVEARVDPNQLRQIVWNLCENAVKHAIADDPAQVIELRCGRLAGSARPYLEVADRGPGVANDQTERIFEPFFSGGRGSGLGLFLARELAQSNGATLLFEPRPGGGSIFRVVFADPRRWENP
jgi:two-component system, NtrC family, sensor histidine kinase PilS